MFQRKQKQTVMSRLQEPRRFLQVIVGSRQVGKSTIIRQVLEEIGMPHLFYSADMEPVSNGAN